MGMVALLLTGAAAAPKQETPPPEKRGMISRFLDMFRRSDVAAEPAQEASPTPEPKPSKTPRKRSIASRVLHPFRGSGEERLPPRLKGLKIEMEIFPLPVRLSESRRLNVVVRLTNQSKRLIQLEFPTTQRLEILIRDAMGKVITQWSEDQYFANAVSTVTINPRERLEYSERISTREMNAGRSYTIEAFIPNYEALKRTQTIVPEL